MALLLLYAYVAAVVNLEMATKCDVNGVGETFEFWLMSMSMNE